MSQMELPTKWAGVNPELRAALVQCALLRLLGRVA